jgi:hypothetical protein
VALARVVDGLVDQVVQRAQAGGRAVQALFLELQHLEHEAHALLADQVALRHAHVVEEELRGVAEECMPILSIFWRVTPGASSGTMISSCSCAPAPRWCWPAGSTSRPACRW